MRRALAVAVAAVVFLLLGGIAWASIPGPDGVIHGCRKNSDGSLRAIDHTATCPSGWTALNWNQTGPQGPSGVTGYEVVQSQVDIPANDTATTVAGEAACPSGKVALGGGGSATAAGAQYMMEYSRLASQNTWQVQFQRTIGPPTGVGNITVKVMCATMSVG